MNPSENPEISAQALLALRREPDAVRLITERLCVKEMGPSDHIRTKHEVKEFVVSGDLKAAELLVRRSVERRSQVLAVKESHSVRQGRTMNQ